MENVAGGRQNTWPSETLIISFFQMMRSFKPYEPFFIICLFKGLLAQIYCLICGSLKNRKTAEQTDTTIPQHTQWHPATTSKPEFKPTLISYTSQKLRFIMRTYVLMIMTIDHGLKKAADKMQHKGIITSAKKNIWFLVKNMNGVHFKMKGLGGGISFSSFIDTFCDEINLKEVKL